MNAEKRSRGSSTAAPEERLSGKQRVLQSAEHLFSTRGFKNVSAAEIARDAGVAHGLLFHHFGSMEELYAAVSAEAAQRLDDALVIPRRAGNARSQVASLLRSHMRAIKERRGDFVIRARTSDATLNGRITEIWESSRQRGIDKILQILGVAHPTKKMRACMRAWIAFHDELLLAMLADRSLSEAEVVALSMAQLERLAQDVLKIELEH